MGKVKVTVTRLTPLRASTRGKPHNPKENHFTGFLYKLIGPFTNNKYLTILEQRACIPAESLEEALNANPARILVYDENGSRQIETSDIVDYKIDGHSAIVDTENWRYEVITNNGKQEETKS